MVNDKTYRFPHYESGRYIITKKELFDSNLIIIRQADADEIEALRQYLDEDNLIWDSENLELTVVDNE